MDYKVCPLIISSGQPCPCWESNCAWWAGAGCAIAELPERLMDISDEVRELQDGLVAIASELNGIV